MDTIFVDIGNSYMKAGIKRGLEWEQLIELENRAYKQFFDWMDERKERFLVCCVDRELSRLLDNRSDEGRLRRIRNRDILPETLHYESPQTLGLDRYFACLGALQMTPESVVVVDAGTACTIDYMGSGGVFHGGVIMPGLKLYASSLAGRIPALKAEGDHLPDHWPGRNTSECVRWGTRGAYLEALSGFLQRYRQTYGGFQIYLTGGDADWIASNLSLQPAPRVRPFLVFEGMNAAMQEFGW